MYLEYLFSLFDDFLVCILESIEIAAGTHLTRDGTFYYIYPPFFPLSIASTSPKSRAPTGSFFFIQNQLKIPCICHGLRNEFLNLPQT